MVIKGGSRGGPRQLARHLQRGDTNERVEIIELQSGIQDLDTTFRDWQLMTEATRGQKGLYHANIDPDARYVMTPEQWQRAADVLEEEFGRMGHNLKGQPRAIVLHEKHGRQHIHVVWQRTDTDTMTLVGDGWNYIVHERASFRLEEEFGHEHVPGKHAKRDRQKQPEFPKAEIDHAEWQQAERSGLDPKERKEQIKALKAASDSPEAFRAALSEHGYILANGDRGYVVLDEAGDVHTLYRDLKQKKPALDAWMAAIPLDTLPTVDQARTLQQERRQWAEQPAAPPPSAEVAPAPGVEASKFLPSDQQPAPAQTAEPPSKFLAPPEPVLAPAQAPPAETTPASDQLSKPEIRALEKALTERHASEAAAIRRRQSFERKHLRDAHEEKLQARLDALRAEQKAERDRFYERGWLKKLADTAKYHIDRVLWRQQKAERRLDKEQMNLRQKADRHDLIHIMRTIRDQALKELEERHTRQRQEHGQQYEKELDRYIREQAAARQLLAEIKEQERAREREEGPDRPPPTHTH